MRLLSRRGVLAAFIVRSPVIAAACILTACGGGGSAQSTLPGASSNVDPLSGTTATGLTVADANSAWTWDAPLTLAWPKGAPASGDMLIACADANYTNTPEAPAGWTALYATSASRKGTALFYKIAGPSEPAAVVFAIPHPYNVGAAMVRVSGAGAAAPIWSHATNAGTGSITTAAVVPNVVGMLPLACFASFNAGEPTNAAGWTLDTREGQEYSALFEQRQSLTTTTTGISVTSINTAPSSATVNDAYGLLVAPAGVIKGLTLTPASIAFGGVKAAAQTATVTQTGNTSFSATSQNCSTVATILGVGNGKFTATPVGVGTCTFTIAGAAGATITLPVSTTATVLTLH